MRRIFMKSIAVGVLLLPMTLFIGCEKEGPMEKAGKSLDDAADKAGDSVKDAADEVGDAVDEGTDH